MNKQKINEKYMSAFAELLEGWAASSYSQLQFPSARVAPRRCW